MKLQLGDTAPDFTAHSTQGEIRFHDWIGDSWCVLFSHPKDFTPVCTTELGYMAGLEAQFAKRNVKIIGLSVDAVDDHERWLNDIEDVTGHRPSHPLIGDPSLSVAKLFGMLGAAVNGSASTRSAMDNATVRNVYVIGPDKKVKLTIAYPMTTGRNFDEILRVIDSLQLTAQHKVATPVNWQTGEEVIIVPAVSDEAAKEKFPAGWRAPKPYIRYVACPQ